MLGHYAFCQKSYNNPIQCFQLLNLLYIAFLQACFQQDFFLKKAPTHLKKPLILMSYLAPTYSNH